MKAKIWLAWKKLNVPAYFNAPPKLPIALPGDLAEIFSKQDVLSGTTAWATPCLSGRSGKIPANLFGALVAMHEEPQKLLFVARKGRRPIIRAIDLDGMSVAREPQFLSENLIIAPKSGKGGNYLFLFARSSAEEVEQIVEDLRDRVGYRRPASVESALEPATTR
jgi:hypothetical protein